MRTTPVRRALWLLLSASSVAAQNVTFDRTCFEGVDSTTILDYKRVAAGTTDCSDTYGGYEFPLMSSSSSSGATGGGTIIVTNVTLGNKQEKKAIAYAYNSSSPGPKDNFRMFPLDWSPNAQGSTKGSITLTKDFITSVLKPNNDSELVFQIKWRLQPDDDGGSGSGSGLGARDSDGAFEYSYSQLWAVSEDPEAYAAAVSSDGSLSTTASAAFDQGSTPQIPDPSASSSSLTTASSSASASASASSGSKQGSSSSSGGKLSTGAIVGIAVGGAAALTLAGLGVACLCVRRRRRTRTRTRSSSSNNNNMEGGGDEGHTMRALMAQKENRSGILEPVPDTPYSEEHDDGQHTASQRPLENINNNNNCRGSSLDGSGAEDLMPAGTRGAAAAAAAIGVAITAGSSSSTSSSPAHTRPSSVVHERQSMMGGGGGSSPSPSPSPSPPERPYSPFTDDNGRDEAADPAQKQRSSASAREEDEVRPASPDGGGGAPALRSAKFARSTTPSGVSGRYAHLVEEGMTEDEIRRMEEEERALDEAIEEAGRTDSRAH